MALQTDGYNADTEGSNNSPLQPEESDEEMDEDKDPEGKLSSHAADCTSNCINASEIHLLIHC